MQDELLTIHEVQVSHDQTKLGPFLQLLRLLRTIIRSQKHVQQWWDQVIAPIVDGVGHKRVEFDQASGYLLDILDNGLGQGTEEDRAKTSAHFANLLLKAYLKRTRIHDVTSEGRAAEDQFIARQLEGVLVTYGCKKPKVSHSDWCQRCRSVLTWIRLSSFLWIVFYSNVHTDCKP